MRNMRRLACMILGFAISIAICRAWNASVHAETTSPIFPMLFPNPTGHNGYEEFVMAADLANSSPVWQEYEQVYFDHPGPTLMMKHRVLSDPALQRTLALIRAGLHKPICSPRESPEVQTLVPELTVFKSLGRLMGVEMCVDFADGRNAQAIDCLRDALNFGYRVQVGTFFSGVVGLYLNDISLRQFADHLDQLSIRDCGRLIPVATDRLNRPDPEIPVLSAERDMYLRSLKKYRSDANALLVQVDPGPNASEADHSAYDSVAQRVKADPATGRMLFDQAAALVSSHFDQTLAVMRQPVWERRYPEPVEIDSLAARLVYSLEPRSFARMSDRYTHELALVHLLGVHAAVRRFRLQNRHLPGSLDELKLGSLALDPFTGQSLNYHRLDDRIYEISSAGPYDPGTSQGPPSGRRVAITLPLPYPP